MKAAAWMKPATVALCAWAMSSASMAASGRSIESVNGSVHAEAGQDYDQLSTVNGQVRVGRGATASAAKTVNGQIVLEDEVKVGEVSTVNGQLDIREGASVEGAASTVNGEIRLAKRARVGGNVSTVSGQIELDGAEVGGSLETHNGDIDLSDGARVRGDIHVKKVQGSSWGKREPVKVHICATCVVQGDLKFDRPVELRVDDGAKIGQVIGDAVTRR